MSPALAEIVALSEKLQALSVSSDWTAMLTVARQRQQLLDHYFASKPLPDPDELVQGTLGKIQKEDGVLNQLARNHRQKMLEEVIDLRQRWQMSDAYQTVQQLQI
ncbi:hypothetical protein HPT27_13535 [Permianibacter sp. IMCC34836]|uniref:hypothetical protein n=1 Tax=Permianibacter fluminis TaxID=2738515 RepID=UPI0015546475|nr:hypothetical protein [Permianibacter fluminis]NQD38049.1 hypothetical protein [Permianibacter fluminis]